MAQGNGAGAINFGGYSRLWSIGLPISWPRPCNRVSIVSGLHNTWLWPSNRLWIWTLCSESYDGNVKRTCGSLTTYVTVSISLISTLFRLRVLLAVDSSITGECHREFHREANRIMHAMKNRPMSLKPWSSELEILFVSIMHLQYCFCGWRVWNFFSMIVNNDVNGDF